MKKTGGTPAAGYVIEKRIIPIRLDYITLHPCIKMTSITKTCQKICTVTYDL
jgi:hypothetical protein